MIRLLLLAIGLTCSLPVAGHGREIGPDDDLQAAVAGLAPGDELVLRGGTYRPHGEWRIIAHGTDSAPIVIRAKAGERPIIRQDDPARNVVEIVDSRHLELRGLAVTGGSHGIRLMRASDIAIVECEVHHTGDVAISANAGGTYRNLRLLRNHIHHTNGTGEGIYFGCNRDRCRVVDSLIEGNHVHHTNGRRVTQGDGIEIKEGSFGNVIRDNVIHDTRYPGILTYGTVGNGSPNLIEGNVVWGSEDHALQVAADAIVHNNVILGTVAFQPHQSGAPANIRFVHNTVVAKGTALSLYGVTGPVVIANNALYARSGPAINLVSGNLRSVTLVGNVGQGGLAGGAIGYREGHGVGRDFVNAHFRGRPPIDPSPARGSPLVGAGDPAHVIAVDFHGRPRTGPADVGAIAFSADGAGWAIEAGFKPVVRSD